MTIDPSAYSISNPPPTYRTYTNQIATTFGSSKWVKYDASFLFTGIACYEPIISFDFVENDFGFDSEWLEVYYASSTYTYTNITRCTGSVDLACSSTVSCLSNYQLFSNDMIGYQSLSLYIIKSKEVNAFCGDTLNANVTLQCRTNGYEINRIVDASATNQYKPDTTYTLDRIQGSVPDITNHEIRYDVNIQFLHGGCYKLRK